MSQLTGRRIAMLVTDGFEQAEMTEPRRALEEAGAEVDLISPNAETVTGWASSDWGDDFDVELSLEKAQAEDYDGLVLPGGVINADKLRTLGRACDLVRAFFDDAKPVAAICHSPWTLIDAGVVEGRRLTSWPSLEMDLTNAGAEWVDEEVVVNRGLVTSRRPSDIPAFNRAFIELLIGTLGGERSLAKQEPASMPAGR